MSSVYARGQNNIRYKTCGSDSTTIRGLFCLYWITFLRNRRASREAQQRTYSSSICNFLCFIASYKYIQLYRYHQCIFFYSIPSFSLSWELCWCIKSFIDWWKPCNVSWHGSIQGGRQKVYFLVAVPESPRQRSAASRLPIATSRLPPWEVGNEIVCYI